MSSIDRDALVSEMRKAYAEATMPASIFVIAADAILPTVEQAIRAAEQRGERQGRIRAADAIRRQREVSAAGYRRVFLHAETLARGGSTDEEQA